VRSIIDIMRRGPHGICVSSEKGRQGKRFICLSDTSTTSLDRYFYKFLITSVCHVLSEIAWFLFFNFFYFLNKSKWKKNCKEKHCTKNESLLWQSNVHLHTHKQITVFGINRWKRLFVSGDNNFLSLDVL